MQHRKRILNIEDEPDLAKITSFRLRKAGYEVLVALDGKQGLEMAEKERFDLILLDLGIPIISGFDVCQILKAKNAFKKIPIIILTASSDKVKEITEEMKADDYIVKPYEPQNLLDKINKHL